MIKRIFPKAFGYFKNVRFFLFALCVTISLFVSGIFYVLYNRTTELIVGRIHEQAVSYENLVRHTKNWNYHYQGVYVKKRPGVESNGYLLHLGINPDIAASDGTVYTIRNHAIMADEISQQMQRHEGVHFRAVSMKPLSEKNLPDATEKGALESFVTGTKHFARIESIPSQPPVYRYIIPLYVEQECLGCHRTQGYVPGDVIGAISVTVPVSGVMREIESNRLLITISAIFTVGLLIGITYFLTWRLVIQLADAQKSLKKLATTDELTGLRNRRHIMQRLEEEFERADRMSEPLCVIIVDIDHFKKINDTHGHPSGDRVLRGVARCLSDNLRSYDLIGRIGGEEFLVVSPGSSLNDTEALAERLLDMVSNESFGNRTCRYNVTISAGIACRTISDATIEDVIKRADSALYRAKHNGRNRVEIEATDSI